MKKALDYLTVTPARFFLLAAILWGVGMYFINKKEGVQWKDIWVEADGMFFDLLVFGILLSIYEALREKNEKIDRYQEEIEDYRGWDEKEASYRIVGLIRRLFKEGVVQLNLSRCNLSGQYLANLDLSKSNLTNANLSRTNLSKANLSGMNLTGTNLSGANLSGANLSGAKLTHVNLSGANMPGVNLSNTNLSGLDISGANLSSSNLSGANLRGANLTGVNFSDAELSGANLFGAYLSNHESMYLIALEEAEKEDFEYSDDDYEAMFDEQDAIDRYGKLLEANPANLSRANLTNAILVQAYLGYVDFTEANLSGANLKRSELSMADLRSANLFGADLTQADLSDAYLENAIVRDTWMERIVSNKVHGFDEILERYSLVEVDGKMVLKSKKKTIK